MLRKNVKKNVSVDNGRWNKFSKKNCNIATNNLIPSTQYENNEKKNVFVPHVFNYRPL